jgi:lysophospholipase L1-like esterase
VQLFDAAQNQIGYINDDGTYDLTSAAYKDARYYRISTNNNLTNPSLTFTYPKYALGLVGQIVGEMGVGDTINMAKGKRAFFWGDSITAGSYGGGYIGKVQNMLGLLSAINYGLNGRNTAGLKTAMIDNNIDYTTCDILTIMIGANDAYNGIINADEASAGDEYKDMPDIALSDISSYPYTYTSAYTTITSATLNNESEYFTKLFASTYIGNLSACIEYVQWKNPNCRIFLVTEYQTGYGANGYSGMRTSRVGIIKVGERYGIPVIDVMSNCGINEKTAHIYLNSDDKLHPTTEGNKVLADFIGREILLNFNNV